MINPRAKLFSSAKEATTAEKGTGRSDVFIAIEVANNKFICVDKLTGYVLCEGPGPMFDKKEI